MEKLSYHQYCKGRKKVLTSKPKHPHFGDSCLITMIIGALIGLIAGIWKNFFPAPENTFSTIGAVLWTITFVLAGTFFGGLCEPPLYFVRLLFIKLRHNANMSAIYNRLEHNPVIQDVLHYVHKNHVKGIIIDENGIRMYNRIWDERYCEDETEKHQVLSEYSLNQLMHDFRKKEYWEIYDLTCIHEVRFLDIGFESMSEDTQICLANYLCRQLSQWGAVQHRAYGFYIERHGGSPTGEAIYDRRTGTITPVRTTSYYEEVTRDIYRDIFVFDLEMAYSAALNRMQGVSPVTQSSKW